MSFLRRELPRTNGGAFGEIHKRLLPIYHAIQGTNFQGKIKEAIRQLGRNPGIPEVQFNHQRKVRKISELAAPLVWLVGLLVSPFGALAVVGFVGSSNSPP
jgi:hypothetical protein